MTRDASASVIAWIKQIKPKTFRSAVNATFHPPIRNSLRNCFFSTFGNATTTSGNTHMRNVYIVLDNCAEAGLSTTEATPKRIAHINAYMTGLLMRSVGFLYTNKSDDPIVSVAPTSFKIENCSPKNINAPKNPTTGLS